MKTLSYASSAQQYGFTLVEMLVALAVGVVVFAGIGQIFISTQKTSIMQDESALLQQNSRYAAHLLASELRHAGYLGCGNPLNLKVVSTGSFADNFTLAVSGYEAAGTAPGDEYTLGGENGSWNPSLPNELSDKGIIAGSDVLVIRRAKKASLVFSEQNENGFIITGPKEKTSKGCNETQDSYFGLCPNDMAIVSDCINARSFKIASLNDGSGNIQLYHNDHWGDPNDINNHFNEKHSRLFKGHTISFFIRKNSRGIPSLYRLISDHSPTPEELIEGVENMQILYGVDSDGDNVVNQYQPADAAIDFRQIISVRIALLLRSTRRKPKIQPPAEKAPEWKLLSTKVTSLDDNLLRRVFSSTIQLRNQGS